MLADDVLRDVWFTVDIPQPIGSPRKAHSGYRIPEVGATVNDS
jgi:hypothetical protein